MQNRILGGECPYNIETVSVDLVERFRQVKGLRDLTSCALFAFFWCLWLEQNAWIFKENMLTLDLLWE